MIPEEAWQLVPPETPSELAPWILPAISQANLSERQGRAYAWVHHILALSRNAVSSWVSDGLVEDLTAGFIRFGGQKDERELLIRNIWKGNPPFRQILAKDGERWSFGIVVGIRSSAIVPSPFVQYTTAGMAFPIIFEVRRVQYDAPDNPVGNATSTCYVRARPGKHYYCGTTWIEGVLVARHVLANAGAAYAGATVAMDTNPASTMMVVDIDPATTIDAAILDSGANLIPATANSLTIVSAVAPGQKVTVHGKKNTFSADVLRTMDDPTYFGNMVAHRAFIDASGAAGDSGAIADLSSGDTVGLYIGEIPSPKEGLLQLMNQVSRYFDVDQYN